MRVRFSSVAPSCKLSAIYKNYLTVCGQSNMTGNEDDDKAVTYDLKLLGCTARKTFTLKFPNLREDLIHHFIRGYFDGDGMLVIYTRTMKRHLNPTSTAEFSIVSTMEMLNGIDKYVNSLGINFKISKRHKDRPNNNFTLRINGNQQIQKMCDYMYKDSTLFLNRKYCTYFELLELVRRGGRRYKYV